MKTMTSRIITSIIILIFFYISSAMAQERSEIEKWANSYCMAAAEIMPNLNTIKVERNNRWELSYALKQIINNTKEGAQRAKSKLNRIYVPKPDKSFITHLKAFVGISKDYSREASDAQKIQTETISALNQIIYAAQKAINGINNAVNRPLFNQAVTPYTQTLRKQESKLNSITNNSSTLIKQLLEKCTLKYMQRK